MPRSPQHRSERRRQLHETREHRLRLLSVLEGHDNSNPLPYLPDLVNSRLVDSRAIADDVDSTVWEQLEDRMHEHRVRTRRERRANIQAGRSQSAGDHEPRRSESHIGWTSTLLPLESPAEESDDIQPIRQVVSTPSIPSLSAIIEAALCSLREKSPKSISADQD